MMKRKNRFLSFSNKLLEWNLCVKDKFFIFFSCMFFYVKTDTLGSYKIRKKKLNFVSIDSHFRKMTNGKLVEISEVHINIRSLHLLLRLQIFYRWANILISFDLPNIFEKQMCIILFTIYRASWFSISVILICTDIAH